MLFRPTEVESAFLIEVEKRTDPRGFFGRVWCQNEFAAQGLTPTFVQGNVAGTSQRGTLRGLHYQDAPYGEAKLVRCTRGSIWDVVLDVRSGSPSYGKWFGAELSADNGKMLYVPEGCAHGYQSLTDDAEVFYLVSNFYAPAAERGVRYDDPTFGIAWPIEVTSLSDKDKAWPLFS